MQLRAVSMAILGVGATVAVLNMAFHPLARMGALAHDNSDLRAHQYRDRTRVRGSAALLGETAGMQQVAILQQPDLVVESMAAATGAAVAAMGIADGAAAQQRTNTAASAEQEVESAGTGSESLAAGTGMGAAEAVSSQQDPGGVQGSEMVVGRHPLQQRVCGSPAVDGYAHVVPQCLVDSPSAKWWFDWEAAGGKPENLVVHIERHADFDGLAVGWGIGNKKASVEECGEACRAHRRNPQGANYEPLPCNAFAWCSEEECFEPDAHKHGLGDCWLKFTEGPASPEANTMMACEHSKHTTALAMMECLTLPMCFERDSVDMATMQVNMRGQLDAAMKLRHPTAPNVVQWHAGVLLPSDVNFGNGTWSPRHDWR